MFHSLVLIFKKCRILIFISWKCDFFADEIIYNQKCQQDKELNFSRTKEITIMNHNSRDRPLASEGANETKNIKSKKIWRKNLCQRKSNQ